MDAGLDRYCQEPWRIDSLGSVLKKYLKKSGLNSRLKHPELYTVWQKALGRSGEHTQIVGVRSGKLEVEVDSAALLQELEFQRHLLLKVLQAEVASPFVTAIQFRLGSFGAKEESK